MRRLTALAALLSLFAGAVVSPLPAQEAPFRPFDRPAFEAAAKKLGATDAQLQQFAIEVDEQGMGRAADRLIRNLVPAFDAAAKLREAGEPRAALELAKVLADHKGGEGDDKARNGVVQAHVRYHLARTFLDGDDPERAVEVLNAYLQQNANLTPLDDEVVYFYAQALAEVPEAEDAMRLFQAYLEWFPQASERYRATAHQRLNELRGQKDNPLHSLADDMKKVGRDLGHRRTGKPTQDKQEELLTELDRLIEMFQQMEQQSSGSPSGNGPSNAPANNSALPGGEATVGNLNKVKGVADRWGDAKDADRKAIEAEIQNSLPPEERKLIEEYYKKLGTSGGR